MGHVNGNWALGCKITGYVTSESKSDKMNCTAQLITKTHKNKLLKIRSESDRDQNLDRDQVSCSKQEFACKRQINIKDL